MEEALTLELENVTLHGTFLTPNRKDTLAVVIIHPGSGPTDRDGNNALGVNSDSLKQLAEQLALRGIASLRIDKRATGESVSKNLAEADRTIDDYWHDLTAWKYELLARVSVPLFLVGHSEGAQISALAVHHNDDNIAGLVCLCSTSQTIFELLREQLSKNEFPRQTEALEILSALESQQPLPEIPQELLAIFRPSVIPYLNSCMRVVPLTTAREIKVPTLVISGSSDLQVSPEDVKRLADASPYSDYYEIDNMSHMLKIVSEDTSQQATYTDPTVPISAELVIRIDSFINHVLENSS